MGYWFSYSVTPRSTTSEWREIKATFAKKLIDWNFEYSVNEFRKAITGSIKNRSIRDCEEVYMLSRLFPTTVFALSSMGEEGDEDAGVMLCNGRSVKKPLLGSLLRIAHKAYLERKQGNSSVMLGVGHAVALMPDGRVAADGFNRYGECNVLEWTQIVQVACGEAHTVGLRADGTVVACGSNANGQCNVDSLEGKAIAVGCGRYHTAILMENGKVVVCGHLESRLEDIKLGWHNKKVYQLKVSPSPKIRAQVNELMEHVNPGDPLQLTIDPKGYEDEPILNVLNSKSEYLGSLKTDENWYIAHMLNEIDVTVDTPMPLSKSNGERKSATMSICIRAKKTEKEKVIPQMPYTQWPAVERIASVYDAVVGMTAEGEIYLDGYQPFSNEVLKNMLMNK